MSAESSPGARAMLLVGAGGAAGAVARWSVAELVQPSADGFPWPTLLVNVLGCLLIGVAAARITRGGDGWHFGVTGVLGGFTTYSAFADEVRGLLGDQAGLAFAYVAATIAGGLLAVEVGRAVAR